MKPFWWMVVGIASVFLLIAIVSNLNDGDTPYDALGLPQPQAASYSTRISSDSTPLPTRAVLNFTDGIVCEDSSTAIECVNTLSGTGDVALLGEYLTLDITNPQIFASGSSVAGTGSISAAYRKWRASSGATAGGTAFGYLDSGDSAPGYTTNGAQNRYDWAKKAALIYKITIPDNTTNGISRLAMGKTFTTGVGALAVKGVSFTVTNLALTGQCHNGTSLTSTGVLMSIPQDTTIWVAVILDGDGTAHFYQTTGGTWGSPTTITGCPNSLSDAAMNFPTIESINGADNATQAIFVHKFIMAVAQ